jgi:hypothetical protein
MRYIVVYKEMLYPLEYILIYISCLEYRESLPLQEQAVLVQIQHKAKGQVLFLNEFFFYVFCHIRRWQCLLELSVTSLDEAVSLSQAGYCKLPKTLSGPAFDSDNEASLVVSKKFVTYFDSLLGAVPIPGS